MNLIHLACLEFYPSSHPKIHPKDVSSKFTNFEQNPRRRKRKAIFFLLYLSSDAKKVSARKVFLRRTLLWSWVFWRGLVYPWATIKFPLSPHFKDPEPVQWACNKVWSSEIASSMCQTKPSLKLLGKEYSDGSCWRWWTWCGHRWKIWSNIYNIANLPVFT